MKTGSWRSFGNPSPRGPTPLSQGLKSTGDTLHCGYEMGLGCLASQCLGGLQSRCLDVKEE